MNKIQNKRLNIYLSPGEPTKEEYHKTYYVSLERQQTQKEKKNPRESVSGKSVSIQIKMQKIAWFNVSK